MNLPTYLQSSLGSRKKRKVKILRPYATSLPCLVIMNWILFMFWHQKLKFLEYETLHCWKSRDFEFHIFCLYLENVWINALKYSFIEILNVLFNSKFCREENILTPASSRVLRPPFLQPNTEGKTILQSSRWEVTLLLLNNHCSCWIVHGQIVSNVPAVSRSNISIRPHRGNVTRVILLPSRV